MTNVGIAKSGWGGDQRETDLVVSVEDDEVGILESEAIFGRFVRLNNGQRPHVPGLGLGSRVIKTWWGAMGEKLLGKSRGLGTVYDRPLNPPSTNQDKGEASRRHPPMEDDFDC
jgi:signal transduction histidine kinase